MSRAIADAILAEWKAVHAKLDADPRDAELAMRVEELWLEHSAAAEASGRSSSSHPVFVVPRDQWSHEGDR